MARNRILERADELLVKAKYPYLMDEEEDEDEEYVEDGAAPDEEEDGEEMEDGDQKEFVEEEREQQAIQPGGLPEKEKKPNPFATANSEGTDAVKKPAGKSPVAPNNGAANGAVAMARDQVVALASQLAEAVGTSSDSKRRLGLLAGGGSMGVKGAVGVIYALKLLRDRGILARFIKELDMHEEAVKKAFPPPKKGNKGPPKKLFGPPPMRDALSALDDSTSELEDRLRSISPKEFVRIVNNVLDGLSEEQIKDVGHAFQEAINRSIRGQPLVDEATEEALLNEDETGAEDAPDKQFEGKDIDEIEAGMSEAEQVLADAKTFREGRRAADAETDAEAQDEPQDEEVDDEEKKKNPFANKKKNPFAKADRLLAIAKFDPDQPRDESGRWTSPGGTATGRVTDYGGYSVEAVRAPGGSTIKAPRTVRNMIIFTDPDVEIDYVRDAAKDLARQYSRSGTSGAISGLAIGGIGAAAGIPLVGAAGVATLLGGLYHLNNARITNRFVKEIDKYLLGMDLPAPGGITLPASKIMMPEQIASALVSARDAEPKPIEYRLSPDELEQIMRSPQVSPYFKRANAVLGKADPLNGLAGKISRIPAAELDKIISRVIDGMSDKEVREFGLALSQAQNPLAKADQVLFLAKKLGADATASDWIHDFVHSDNPRFKGKSKKERIRMALGAYYGQGRGGGGGRKKKALQRADDVLAKAGFDPGQSRDDLGRWDGGDGGDIGSTMAGRMGGRAAVRHITTMGSIAGGFGGGGGRQSDETAERDLRAIMGGGGGGLANKKWSNMNDSERYLRMEAMENYVADRIKYGRGKEHSDAIRDQARLKEATVQGEKELFDVVSNWHNRQQQQAAAGERKVHEARLSQNQDVREAIEASGVEIDADDPAKFKPQWYELHQMQPGWRKTLATVATTIADVGRNVKTVLDFAPLLTGGKRTELLADVTNTLNGLTYLSSSIRTAASAKDPQTFRMGLEGASREVSRLRSSIPALASSAESAGGAVSSYVGTQLNAAGRQLADLETSIKQTETGRKIYETGQQAVRASLGTGGVQVLTARSLPSVSGALQRPSGGTESLLFARMGPVKPSSFRSTRLYTPRTETSRAETEIRTRSSVYHPNPLPSYSPVRFQSTLGRTPISSASTLRVSSVRPSLSIADQIRRYGRVVEY